MTMQNRELTYFPFTDTNIDHFVLTMTETGTLELVISNWLGQMTFTFLGLSKFSYNFIGSGIVDCEWDTKSFTKTLKLFINTRSDAPDLEVHFERAIYGKVSS